MTAAQFDRIRKMEDDFKRVGEVVRSLDKALSDYKAVRCRISRLTEYQESGQWLKDFEADERGELPPYSELKRGVLSEDGLDNLLLEVSDLQARMQALLGKPDGI